MSFDGRSIPRKPENTDRSRGTGKQFLRENGLNDDAPRFAEILKLFREHGGRQR
jgi:hypothetical protein